MQENNNTEQSLRTCVKELLNEIAALREEAIYHRGLPMDEITGWCSTTIDNAISEYSEVIQ